MTSDPGQCLYCTNNDTLHELMIEICHLRVSRVFLFKEQTYRGRLLVAYDQHVDSPLDISEENRVLLMQDVNNALAAIKEVCKPDKTNIGAFADTLQHLHFHLVPKYVGGPDWGGTFQMNPKKVYLTEPEYDKLVKQYKAILSR